MSSETIDHDQLKSNIKNSSNWQRLAFMILFAILLQLASAIMWVLCSIQFLFALLTGRDNENLRQLGSSIAAFVHQALQYLSYNSNDKPFPFGEWPEPEQNAPNTNDATNETASQTDESGSVDEDIIEGEVIEISSDDVDADSTDKDEPAQ